MEIILIILMLLMLLVLVGLGIGGFMLYRKLNEKPKEPEVTNFNEEVKKLFDMQDKEQKQVYDELMEAWNYTHKKKELKNEQS